jgi:hypothetical protein
MRVSRIATFPAKTANVGTKSSLTAAGWPLSELFDRQIMKKLDIEFNLNLSPVLDSTDRVPSLPSGGLGDISPLWWGFCLGLTAAIDLKGVMNSRCSRWYRRRKLWF